MSGMSKIVFDDCYPDPRTSHSDHHRHGTRWNPKAYSAGRVNHLGPISVDVSSPAHRPPPYRPIDDDGEPLVVFSHTNSVRSAPYPTTSSMRDGHQDTAAHGGRSHYQRNLHHHRQHSRMPYVDDGAGPIVKSRTSSSTSSAELLEVYYEYPQFGEIDGRLTYGGQRVDEDDEDSRFSDVRGFKQHRVSAAVNYQVQDEAMRTPKWEVDMSSTETNGSSLPPDVDDASVRSVKPKPFEELCRICGDRASGYHYNALSCEGCKGFFRRSVTRGASYVCKYGGNCEMDMWMRRKCQACRLQQCRTVGMKEECLLSERQCTARNFRRQTRPKVNKSRFPRHRLGTTSATTLSVASVLNSEGPMTPPSMGGLTDDCKSPMCHSPLAQLSEEHRQLVTRIVAYQDKYELPTPEDIARISGLNIASSFANGDASDAVFGHMVEMTILVTRLVVEFAKHLPGFQSICKEDQITLLKGSASEVMMLRTSRRFDPETNTVVFGDGQPFSQNCMAFGGLQGFVDLMFDFSRGMASLTVDNAEYALVTAMCIFSDRPGIKNKKMIENIQEVYSDVLRSYVGHRRLYGNIFLAKLLMKLVELRSLSAEHSECLFRLTVERGALPPLLCEYFDIPKPSPE